MLRFAFGLMLVLVACEDRSFVPRSADDEIRTEIYLVREAGQDWRAHVRAVGDGAFELRDPEEVYLYQYTAEPDTVVAWRSEPSVESCALLAARAQRLELADPLEFTEVEATEAHYELLFPRWDELCVNCRPFDVRSVLYPVGPGGPDEIRNGGGNAPLPSGAFLAAGRSEDGLFKVTANEAQSLGVGASHKIPRLLRMSDGRYLAAEGPLLRVLEVDASESSVTFGATLSVPEDIFENAILDLKVSPPGSRLEALLIDIKGRVFRSDLTSLELVVELPPPTGGRLGRASLIWFERDHFMAAADQATVFEWNEGRISRHELAASSASTLAEVPGFGILVGTDQAEVLVLDLPAWRPVAVAGLLDDVNAIVPYRNGFLLAMKGGFIDQFAPHLGRVCPESTPLPGAQNSSLRAFSPVPAGFLCSDCLQSRSGGNYGALWLEQK